MHFNNVANISWKFLRQSFATKIYTTTKTRIRLLKFKSGEHDIQPMVLHSLDNQVIYKYAHIINHNIG